MRILIVGLNYHPEPVGIGPFTTGTARALAAAGHEVQVLSGKPYYPAWKIEPEWRSPLYRTSVEDGITVTRCPLYVPGKDSGMRRIIHHASFAITLIPAAIRAIILFRPQLVLTIAPSMLSSPVSRAIAWLCGAKQWLHIQDFEVEAAFATELLAENSMVGKLAGWFEISQLRTANKVSTISPQMCRKLSDKGLADNRIVEFRNWAEIDAIRPLETPSPYRERWTINAPYVAFYSGNIANKQGIEIIIEAARLLRHRKDLVFVICGDGPNRANLEEMAQDLGNVQLHDLQPREQLGDLLGLATVHLLPQIPGAADLVLPSKLANMLASGRPVIATADEGTGLAAEVEGAGVVTPPGDAVAFANAITELINSPEECKRLGDAARARAEQRWSRDAVLAKFVDDVQAVDI